MRKLVDSYCGCGIVEIEEIDNTDDDDDWILQYLIANRLIGNC